MMVVAYTDKELDLLARLMRAEAVGEGEVGMLMVGNVAVNRAIADCLVFKDIRTIQQVVYQNPSGFSGTTSPLFFSSATEKEKELAQMVLNGKTFWPATHALWFYAPKTGQSCVGLWYDQQLSGRYRNHCFYRPYEGVCPQLY